MEKVILGYTIKNGVVTTPSGKSQKVNYFTKATGKAKIMADKAGLKNAVTCGKMILPQEVAEEAISQLDAIAEAAANNLKNAIPGLDELQEAIANNESEYRRYDRDMERADLDGLVTPPDIIDIEPLKAQYPVAAAYVKAEKYYFSSHYAKSAAGKEAMDRIKNGDNPQVVIAEMEAAWSAHCAKALD